MIENNINLDLTITCMAKKLHVSTVHTYWFSSDRQSFTAVEVFSSIENRPLSSKNFVICVNHRLDNISVHAPWTLIGRYTKIVMMYVSFGKANLKKICPESDRSSHCSKVRSFRWGEISTDTISCKHKRKLQKKNNESKMAVYFTQ